MPIVLCPRCNTQLREEDTAVFEGPKWRQGSVLVVHLECWACSWTAEWQAANCIQTEEMTNAKV